MAGKRREQSEDFKRDAISLSYKSDKSMTEIADDLGIHRSVLVRWRKEFEELGEKALAKGTSSIRLPIDAFTLELKLLVEQIEFIEKQVSILEEAVELILEELRTNPKQPYRHVLETIPGISSVLAAAMIGG